VQAHATVDHCPDLVLDALLLPPSNLVTYPLWADIPGRLPLQVFTWCPPSCLLRSAGVCPAWRRAGVSREASWLQQLQWLQCENRMSAHVGMIRRRLFLMFFATTSFSLDVADCCRHL
jgi:hypothetical protein